MKSILMSIQPKWIEKIVSGEKTIEVRKTAPKEVPFKVYVYCTKGENLYLDYECMPSWSGGFHINENNSADYYNDQLLNGKVIGEFICDKVALYVPMQKNYFIGNSDFYKTCLTDEEINNYGKGKDLYGYNITDLKVYDEPKEIGEFKSKQKVYLYGNKDYPFGTDYLPITRPPQSWQYIQELED